MGVLLRDTLSVLNRGVQYTVSDGNAGLMAPCGVAKARCERAASSVIFTLGTGWK